MTLLWDVDPAATERYNFSVGGDITRVETASQLTRALQEHPEEHLVLVGPDVDARSAFDFADSTRVDRPEVGVLLLRRRLDVAVLAQALRAGAREVVSADDLSALSDAARRSRRLSQQMAGHAADSGTREGRIVTVFSAKGGVGKTTFSTNLGAYLASTGCRVLVVDLDLAFGDVAISLQLLAQNTAADLVSMSGHIDPSGLRSVVTHHDSGLDVIAAPADPSEADRIPSHTIGEALRVAKRCYDFVVVDTPPAFTEPVLAAFDASDVLVLIATLDIPAVKNLRVTLDTLDLLGNPKDSRVVVLNRSDAKVGLKPEDVVAALKQDIAVTVPNSTAVPASVNRGVPIVLDEPKHPVSVAIRQLADGYLRGTAATDGAGATSREESKRSRSERRLFSRGGRQ
jgi:pilus assembly protein CpaE